MSNNGLKSIVIALGLLLAATSASSAPFEIVKQNDKGSWVVDGVDISYAIDCDINNDFFPEKYCSEPIVVINSAPSLFQFKIGDFEIGSKWAFKDNIDPKAPVPGDEIFIGETKSTELFKALNSGDPKSDNTIEIKTRDSINSPIKTRTVKLHGFKAGFAEQLEHYQTSLDYDIEQKKQENIRFLLIFTFIIIGIFFISRYLFKKAKSKAIQVKDSLEARKVSKIAEEEAIRETVRTSMKQADDASIETLKNQIKAALDAGDSKTAGNLLKVLDTIQNSNTKS